MVTLDERLKILDFGLAKLMIPPRSCQPARSLDYLPARRAGTLVTRPPSNSSGQFVDHRTDIDAVGTVPHEMVAGRHPFQGSSFGSLIDNILRSPPVPPSRFRSTLSGRLRNKKDRQTGSVPEKDSENRYQSARDLLVDMRRLLGSTDPLPAHLPRARPRRSRRLAWAGLALAAVTAATAVLWWSAGAGNAEGSPSKSRGEPHGKGSRSWRPTEGVSRLCPCSDFGNLEIRLIDVHGGHPLNLTNHPAADQGPAWFPDGGAIAFASDRGGAWGIWKVGQYGGDATQILVDARQPSISPDGNRIAFARRLEKGYTRIGVALLSDPLPISRSSPGTKKVSGTMKIRHGRWTAGRFAMRAGMARGWSRHPVERPADSLKRRNSSDFAPGCPRAGDTYTLHLIAAARSPCGASRPGAVSRSG